MVMKTMLIDFWAETLAFQNHWRPHLANHWPIIGGGRVVSCGGLEGGAAVRVAAWRVQPSTMGEARLIGARASSWR